MQEINQIYSLRAAPGLMIMSHVLCVCGVVIDVRCFNGVSNNTVRFVNRIQPMLLT
jgi:hypothetical protein